MWRFDPAREVKPDDGRIGWFVCRHDPVLISRPRRVDGLSDALLIGVSPRRWNPMGVGVVEGDGHMQPPNDTVMRRRRIASLPRLAALGVHRADPVTKPTFLHWRLCSIKPILGAAQPQRMSRPSTER